MITNECSEQNRIQYKILRIIALNAHSTDSATFYPVVYFIHGNHVPFFILGALSVGKSDTSS